MAPLAINVAELPEQTVALLTVMVGLLFTVTLVVVDPVHEPLAPVIVYVVFTIWVAITLVPFEEFNVDEGDQV